MLRIAILSAIVGLVLPAFLLAQAPGSLDLSFGDQGKKIITAGTGNAFGQGIVISDDGKILIAGIASNGTDNDFVLMRLFSDGNVDPEFGDNGEVFTDFAGLTDIAESIAVDSLDRIVVAGTTDSGDGFWFAVARYWPDGQPDSTFGVNGRVMIQVGITAFCKAVVIQPDQKILLGGYATNPASGTNEFTLVRLDSNGKPDDTFGDQGIVLTNLEIGAAVANALTIQPDGKIVQAGQALRDATFRWEIAIVRYHDDGSLDASWDEDGIAFTSIPNVDATINTIAIKSNNKIIVGGYSGTAPSNNLFLVARYETSGVPDLLFGDHGIIINSFGAQDNQITDLVLQPDGHIIVAGSSLSGIGDRFSIARLDNGGDLDASFGNGGVVITPIGANAGIGAIALQNDGKLVVVGESFSTPRFDIVAARYETGLMTAVDHEDVSSFEVNIYPNPFTEYLNIQTPLSIEANLFDVYGHLLMRKMVDAGEGRLDLKMFPAGTYTIRIKEIESNRESSMMIVKTSK